MVQMLQVVQCQENLELRVWDGVGLGLDIITLQPVSRSKDKTGNTYGHKPSEFALGPECSSHLDIACLNDMSGGAQGV